MEQVYLEKNNKNDVCNKSQIRETAIYRFYKYPVCFDLEKIFLTLIKLIILMYLNKLDIKFINFESKVDKLFIIL